MHSKTALDNNVNSAHDDSEKGGILIPAQHDVTRRVVLFCGSIYLALNRHACEAR